MKLQKFGMLALAVIVCMALNVLAGISTQAVAGEYSFKVHNSTKNTITKILVSEDKKTWGEFEVGSGIKAGKSMELVWDESTNNEGCKQWVKAVFDDGSEAPPAKFDFCEKNLELQF